MADGTNFDQATSCTLLEVSHTHKFFEQYFFDSQVLLS